MENFLPKKVCLITGARTGIGKSISELFAYNGYRVIMTAKNIEDCGATADKLNELGHDAISLKFDLSQPERITETVVKAKGIWGKIDIIVNNAATVEPIDRLGNIKLQDLKKSIDVNFLSPAIIINNFWKTLKDSEGKILNILSGAAVAPIDGWLSYCSTKAALHMINQQAHLEGEQYNIKSIGISPGMVDTAMQQKIRESGINHVSKVKKSELIPTDLPAEFCLWAASDDANDLSGRMISLKEMEIYERFNKWKKRNISMNS